MPRYITFDKWIGPLLLWPLFAVAILTIILLCLLHNPTNEKKPVAMPLIEGDDSVPVAAVFVDLSLAYLKPTSSPIDQDEPRVVMVVWGNGRVIWSEKPIRGGPPYREAFIEPGTVKAALREILACDDLNDPILSEDSFGPDSSFTTIAIADGNVRFGMNSWHELGEMDPEWIGVNGAVMKLEGRTREQVIATWSKDYRHYRKTWSLIRDKLKTLIPNSGKPVEVRFLRREQPDKSK